MWQAIQSRVDGVLKDIRGSTVLNAAARAGLKSIPWVGDVLVQLYDAGADKEPDKLVKLDAILEQIRTGDEEHFVHLKASLEESHAELMRSTTALDAVLERIQQTGEQLQRLEQGQGDLQASSQRVEDTLVGLRAQLDELDAESYAFDLDVPAERLVFFYRLSHQLQKAYDVFVLQNHMARLLLKRVVEKTSVQPSRGGLDDALRELYSVMDDDDLAIREHLRRMTDQTWALNRRKKRLLANNRTLFQSAPLLEALYEHYCVWCAKYELLKDDPTMCLVYAGVAQRKPFPPGIDDMVTEEVARLRKETLLEG